MVSQEELYARYNRLLAFNITTFLERNQELLFSDDYKEKKLLMERLQHRMEMAAIRKLWKVDKKQCPLKYAFKKMYRLLFQGVLGSSYLSLLRRAANEQETNKLTEAIKKAIAKKEERIIILLEDMLSHVNLPIDADLHGAAETYKKSMNQLLYTNRRSNNFNTRLVYACLLMVGFNLLAINLFSLEHKPYTDRKALEQIMRETIFQAARRYEETYTIDQSGHLIITQHAS